MVDKFLDAKVLGQLLLMQSVVINLPDRNSIFSFICKGIKDIPGVEEVKYRPSITKNKLIQDNIIYYPISLNHAFYGELTVALYSKESFSPYVDYMNNFIFMIGVILEERNQRQLNKTYQLELEQRIEERTAELKKEKENLIESQRRFNDLMSNVRLVSVMLDNKGNIIFCNNFLLNVSGYSYDEVIGKNWFDLFMPDEIKEEIKQIFQNSILGNVFSADYENEILTKSGNKLLISWNNTMLYDADKNIIGTASIGEDITQRKKNEILLKEKTEEIEAQNEEYQQLNEELFKAKEKAEESDQLKTAFLQNMSHEIRTPLNAIMGFSNLLTNNFNNKEKLKKFIEIINLSCNDLLNLINDIIDISKIESGSLIVKQEKCSLKTLFSDLNIIYNQLQLRHGKENVPFLYEIDDNLDTIITDNGKLKQILINLVSNALKFTDEGNITCKCLKENNNILFSVSDTGVGIASDKFDSIFERFTQINPTKQKNLGGTGLGLSIVKGLVGLLKGNVWLESEIGKGTTFYFTIKLKEPDSEKVNNPVEDATINPPDKKKTILIVEDDYYNIVFLKEVFAGTKFNIITTELGQEAIKIIKNQRIDIILMDIRLPDINGYDVTKSILETNPKMKVIAQTAFATLNERDKAIESGCVDYISKPISPKELLKLVEIHIKK